MGLSADATLTVLLLAALLFIYMFAKRQTYKMVAAARKAENGHSPDLYDARRGS